MDELGSFAQALLNSDATMPPHLKAWNGADPLVRFNTYKNNVTLSLIEALADSFPVVQQLVGQQFFGAMAYEYVLKNPPDSPVLNNYGDSFSTFIKLFSPANSLPYLADVAQLEWGYIRAYHSADTPAISIEFFHQFLDFPKVLPTLKVKLHPSLQLIPSNFPIVSIWEAHQECTKDLSTIDMSQEETALILRDRLQVLIYSVHPASASFINSLAEGKALGEALSAVQASYPDFDVFESISLLLQHQVITNLILPNEGSQNELISNRCI